jgi:outer membrane autotransporter protein
MYAFSRSWLSVEKADFTTLKSMTGARVAMPFDLESGRKIVPEARAVWAHEYLDNQSSFMARIQGAPDTDRFLVEGRRYKRDTAILGVGLTVPLSDEASVAIDYDASINPDIVTHTVSGGFRLKW